MKNEIFLITFLLIIFFSLGENNSNYQNLKLSDMYWEDVGSTTTSFEKRNLKNSKLKFRTHNYYQNDEYIKQVQNEIKKLSKDISDLKLEATFSKARTKSDFFDGLLSINSNRNEQDEYGHSPPSSPKSNWKEIKNKYINPLDSVNNTLDKNQELMKK